MAVNMGMFIDSAVPIEQRKSVAMAALYAVRLPKVWIISVSVHQDTSSSADVTYPSDRRPDQGRGAHSQQDTSVRDINVFGSSAELC